MFYVSFYYKKPDEIYERCIYAYNTYDEAINKYIELKNKYQNFSSDYFQCFISDDEGRYLK